jgi:hypothetical protein
MLTSCVLFVSPAARSLLLSHLRRRRTPSPFPRAAAGGNQAMLPPIIRQPAAGHQYHLEVLPTGKQAAGAVR